MEQTILLPLAGESESREEYFAAPRNVLGGRFVLTKRLKASGAEADVWLARDESAGNDVAVKVHRPDFGRSIDYDQISGIHDRHVACPIASGEERGTSWVAMEFFPGGDLSSVVRKGPMPEADVRSLLRQLASGLAALHKANIQHRDLKPQNILLRKSEGLDVAIADFGSSRDSEGTCLTTMGMQTLEYASPESLTGISSAAGDWYSAGMIVMECLVGKHPLAHVGDMRRKMYKIVSGEIEMPSAVPPRWRPLLSGLLRSDHARRFGAAEVAKWLDCEESGRPFTEAANERAREVEDKRIPVSETTFFGILAGGVSAGIVCMAMFFDLTTLNVVKKADETTRKAIMAAAARDAFLNGVEQGISDADLDKRVAGFLMKDGKPMTELPLDPATKKPYSLYKDGKMVPLVTE